MAFATLNGSETLYVLGQNPASKPAATTEITTTGAIAALAGSNPKVAVTVAATATATVGNTYLLNAATGSVLTLPAATGTGGVVRVIVSTTVTSNSHKVLAASSSDNMQGVIITQKTSTCSGWGALISGTLHSLQMPATGSNPQGGIQGDNIELRDIALNVWEVTGMTTSGGTVATPFSTATT